MDVLLEILKYALPSVLLLILCYLMLANFMDNEEKRRSYFLKKETQKSALPVRMQAYERITLFFALYIANWYGKSYLVPVDLQFFIFFL